jgi:hypothetical protein
MSRSPDEERSRTVLVVVSALAALAFFLQRLRRRAAAPWRSGRPLPVRPVFHLSLFFRLFRRFVRAHERIATALESRIDVGRSDDRR